MMRLFFLLTFLVIFCFALSPPGLSWVQNFEVAKSVAKREDRAILLVFSGSDWCRNCILLDREVFGSDEFDSLAKDQLVLVKADFPRKKKNQLSPDRQKQNAELARRFNPMGEFPLVVLLDPSENILVTSSYRQGKGKEFIDRLRESL